ncbi:MAG: HAD-IA family hydrolase [Clostridiales Family XIII bacterium]|jgi:pyrophosphatase PpaX|nr:HAD-IA family hydrolase [Clostridiales Family XIII bacterium]
MKINTILFDYDGTLMDTESPIKKAWRYVFHHYANQSVEDDFLNTFLGEPVRLSVERLFPGQDAEEIVNAYRACQRDIYLNEIDLYPGMDKLAMELKEKGYRLGIVTSRLRSSLEQGLNKYGLLSVFDCLITPEDIPQIKPAPEPFFAALKMLDSTADRTLMIGDSEYDVQGSRNAGILSILVHWSLPLPEAMRVGENKPDFVIHDAEDVWEILEELK